MRTYLPAWVLKGRGTRVTLVLDGEDLRPIARGHNSELKRHWTEPVSSHDTGFCVYRHSLAVTPLIEVRP